MPNEFLPQIKSNLYFAPGIIQNTVYFTGEFI